MSPEPSILLSAGEASGDLHGATLCRALRELHPGVRLIGMGGPRMAAAGMELVADVSGHAVVGTSEALGRFPRLYRAYRLLKARLIEERPRALVVIDFPEFNLRLARIARRAGVPVVYFIPPQLWAWRRGRIRQMARRVSRVLAVLPFEEALPGRRRARRLRGASIARRAALDLDRAEARRRLGARSPERVADRASCRGAAGRRWSAFCHRCSWGRQRLSAAGVRRGGSRSAWPPPWRGRPSPARRGRGRRGRPRVDALRAAGPYEVMAAADVVLISSGTATLEAALLGAPMVVCYRVSRVTEAVVRLLVKVRWCSLPNLIANRGVVPEVLQDELTGQRLAAEALRLIEDPAAAGAQRAAFEHVRAQLGAPGVGRRAAQAVIETARLGVPVPRA